MNLQRTLDGHRISGEIRHARTGAEDHDAALLQVADGLERNVRLGDLAHGDGRLHAGGLPLLLQEILQREAVHHRAQHAHVIAAGTVDAGLLQFRAAEEVASADDDGDLNALPHGGDDLLGDATNHLRIDADLSAAERLTRQFQQYPSWLIRRYSICHA